MTEFDRQDLSSATFNRVKLVDTEFRASDLTGARFIGSALHRVVMRGVELCDVEISGDIENVVVNGVEIGPLITAELNRREPERVLMRPSDPAGFRQAWSIIERRWAETEARARSLAPAQLHQSVDGEWSFIETLRHLIFATDSWFGRAVRGERAPWHLFGLPWDEIPDRITGVPHDRTVRPSLDEVLAVRHGRMAGVRDYLAALTAEQLAADTEPVEGPGWPPPQSFPVRECLLILLNEEWEHRNFAARDLAVLAG